MIFFTASYVNVLNKVCGIIGVPVAATQFITGESPYTN
jgi:hypothetical protein